MKTKSTGKNKAESIRDYILERIQTREYVHRIPALNSLATSFKVNIKTVKRAVEELEKQELLYSHKGKGTFIRSDATFHAPILFIGRGGKEVSQIIATELASAVNFLGADYLSYSFLLPRERLESSKLKLPMCNDIAGILVEGDLIDCFREIPPLPIIQIHSTSLSKSYPRVTADHADGIRQAINYLASLGHRKLAYLGADELSGHPCEGQSVVKREAFDSWVRELNLENRPEWNISAYYRIQAGYHAAMELFRYPCRPTAVICVNDEVAIGVINACDELGIRVPKEFSVIGFDDRAPATMRKPFLTTVKVDFRQMVQEAVRTLDFLIRNRHTDTGKEIRIPTQLIIRDSTGSCQALPNRM